MKMVVICLSMQFHRGISDGGLWSLRSLVIKQKNSTYWNGTVYYYHHRISSVSFRATPYLLSKNSHERDLVCRIRANESQMNSLTAFPTRGEYEKCSCVFDRLLTKNKSFIHTEDKLARSFSRKLCRSSRSERLIAPKQASGFTNVWVSTASAVCIQMAAGSSSLKLTGKVWCNRLADRCAAWPVKEQRMHAGL